MFKIIKKELEDIKNHKEHMEYIPPYTINPKDNFDEFIKLTTRSNARFKVSGDYKNFVIQASSDKWLFVILFVIMFFFMTLALSEDFTNPMYWLVIIAILTTVVITFRYYPSSNNVNINSYNKTITICNNNLIGKYIVPKIVISFKDFTSFSHKAKSYKSQSVTTNSNRIYICYSDQKRFFIDLPNGPYYFVNHKIFMETLTRIIKNAT